MTAFLSLSTFTPAGSAKTGADRTKRTEATRRTLMTGLRMSFGSDAHNRRRLAGVFAFQIARRQVEPAAVNGDAAVIHARQLERLGAQIESPLRGSGFQIDRMDDPLQICGI